MVYRYIQLYTTQCPKMMIVTNHVGMSNDTLHCGPDLLQSQVEIVFNYRGHKSGFSREVKAKKKFTTSMTI